MNSKHVLLLVGAICIFMSKPVLTMEKEYLEVPRKRKFELPVSAKKTRPIKGRKTGELGVFEETHVPESETALDIEKLEETVTPMESEVDLGALEKTKVDIADPELARAVTRLSEELLATPNAESAISILANIPKDRLTQEQFERLLSDLAKEYNVRHPDSAIRILIIASGMGAQDIVKALLNGGVPINSRLQKVTPLEQALLHRQYSLADFLAQHGADIDALNEAGTPLLGMAAKGGDKKMVDLLVDYGAQLNAPDKQGNTPLLIASVNGFQEIVSDLLTHGADVNAKNGVGYTPLMGAVSNNHPELVKLLLSYNPRLEDADLFGYTPLRLAAKNPAITELLLQALYQK
jgi:hypothetical protein